MSEQTVQAQADAVRPSDVINGRRRIALDKAFPTVTLLGAVILLVSVLSLLSGWKVFHLEQERAALQRDRALLDKSLQDHAKFTQELPQLKDKHQELTTSIADLQGQRDVLKTAVEKVRMEVVDRRQELQAALAKRDQTEASAQAAREEHGKLTAAIEQANSQVGSLQQRVAELSSKEKSLLQSTSDMQNMAAALEADLKGLERKRVNEQQMLERMTADRAELNSLAGRIGAVAGKLEASGEEAGRALQALGGRNAELGKAVDQVSAQAVAVSRQAQDLSTQSGSLRKVSQDLTATTQDVQKAASTLAKGEQAVAGAAVKLEDAAAAVDTQAKNLARTAKGPLDGLAVATGKLTDIVAKLSSSSSALGDGTADMRSQTAAMLKQIGEMDLAVQGLKQAIAAVQAVDGKSAALREEVARDLGSLHTLAAEAQQGLKADAGALTKLLADIRTRVESIAAHMEELDQAVQAAARARSTGR